MWALGLALQVAAPAVLVAAAPAASDRVVLMAPYGGAPVPLGTPGGAKNPAIQFCRGSAQLRGWTLVADGNDAAARLQPPPVGSSGAAHLVWTANAADCEPAAAAASAGPAAREEASGEGRSRTSPGASAAGRERFPSRVTTALPYAALPQVEPQSVVWNVDAGRLDVAGRNLAGALLRWRFAAPATSAPVASGGDEEGAVDGSDVCRDPQEGAGGLQTCSFTLARTLLAEPLALQLTFYPAGTPAQGRVQVFDALARPQHLPTLLPEKSLLSAVLGVDGAVALQTDGGRLPLRHPEAVGSASCEQALCQVEDGSLSIHGELGGAASLAVTLQLRPHLFFVDPDGSLRSSRTLALPVQRCPVSLASPPPLRGLVGQRLVLRLGDACAREGSLQYVVNDAPSRVVQTQRLAEGIYVVLAAGPIAGEEVRIVAHHGAQVVGTANARSQPSPTLHSRLRLGPFGEVDFIPINREVTALMPTLAGGGQVVPVGLPGVYEASRGSDDAYRLRGAETTTGWVSLRLALRDRSLPPQLRELDLATWNDPLERQLRPASLPVNLTDDSLVELRCGAPPHGPTALQPGRSVSVDFADRDSCHLVLHRERLAPEDGEQTLRLTASVSAVDGTPRPEAQLDQVVRLRPGLKARTIYLGGTLAPFDRVLVRVAVLADDAHYSVVLDEKVGAPPLQWPLIMGTSRARFFATTAFPTGLFRVADAGHSGIMGLNSGVLFRLVGLDRNGRQTLVGLEAGMMWLGIAGDQTQSKLGQAALVGGISISVPIANVSRLAQASISLHAWAEYEVSRAWLHTGGQPWGFVFGPSLSVGDVGLNF